LEECANNLKEVPIFFRKTHQFEGFQKKPDFQSQMGSFPGMKQFKGV